jgi:hypothetical protein
MDSYTLLQVSEAFGVVVVGMGSAYFSRRAMKLSEPTGNGFASLVVSSLNRIHDRLDKLEAKVDGLQK